MLLADLPPPFDSRVRVALCFILEGWVVVGLTVNVAYCGNRVSLISVVFGGVGGVMSRG